MTTTPDAPRDPATDPNHDLDRTPQDLPDEGSQVGEVGDDGNDGDDEADDDRQTEQNQPHR